MLLPGADLIVEFTLRHPTTGTAADADSTPTGTLVRNGTDTAVTVTIANKATGIYKATVAIPSSYVAGDMIQIRIAATVNSVADNFDVWSETLDDASISAGVGGTVVDHDYGGTDELQITDDEGAGIDDALIRAYLKADYDAGNRSAAYIKATVRTDVDGRWSSPMLLDADVYTLFIYKQGAYGPNTQEITVT